MTPGEFNAWLDGYLENLGSRPSKAQIDRIREKAAEMTAEPPIMIPSPFWQIPLPIGSGTTSPQGTDIVGTDISYRVEQDANIRRGTNFWL